MPYYCGEGFVGEVCEGAQYDAYDQDGEDDEDDCLKYAVLGFQGGHEADQFCSCGWREWERENSADICPATYSRCSHHYGVHYVADEGEVSTNGYEDAERGYPFEDLPYEPPFSGEWWGWIRNWGCVFAFCFGVKGVLE